ncbi:death ligand signal enhancer isoform X2 [Ahaetulla prasina]|uniref:death ligand signal enhancer isoform X2 n=1 Tax=Ahaetulla prasina TaxID=499056 RepID=UPI002647A0C8|nr:death ligand signal enhancer isoform X2 [Ahaetulla prasina]
MRVLSYSNAKPIRRRKMWRWLWNFSRGVRSPGEAVASLFRSRLQEGESLLLVQEFTQTDNSWHGKHQQHKTFGDRNVYCYTPLEAFTWNTLADLALELTKQAHWLHSVQPDRRNTKVYQSEPRNADLSQCHQSGNFVFSSSTSFESDSFLLDLKSFLVESDWPLVRSHIQTYLVAIRAAKRLENLQDEQYKMAFSCFKMAADHNYRRAQYNVGLCYEHGRGTTKDMTKAILYYQRAAHQGHLLAQYRYVKWLFCCWYKAATQNQNELPLKERTSLSSPCLQSLGQPLSAHLGQPAVGLLHSWSIGHLEDMADNCELQSYLGLSDEVSIELQPLPCCSEKIVD